MSAQHPKVSPEAETTLSLVVRQKAVQAIELEQDAAVQAIEQEHRRPVRLMWGMAFLLGTELVTLLGLSSLIFYAFRHAPSSPAGFVSALISAIGLGVVSFLLIKRMRWSAPLRTLLGLAFLALPALAFPPKARRAWVREAAEMVTSRKDQGMTYGGVLSSLVARWPAEMLASWLEEAVGPAPDLALGQDTPDVPLPEPPRRRGVRGFWQRHGGEIGWALVFAVAVAFGYEVLHAWMESHGQVFVWDTWVPEH